MGWREDVKLGIGRIGTLFLGDGNGQMGVELTATAAELNTVGDALSDYLVASTAQVTLAEADVLDGATAGTQVASKAIVTDANVNQGVAKATELHIGATGSEVQVTSTPAELNILDGATVTPAELNVLDGGIGSIVTSSETGASGSVAVQLQFKDSAGVNMTVPVSGIMYFADDSAGLAHAVVETSVVTLTNGSVSEASAAHNVISFVTDATGQLGFTLTANADSFWGVYAGPTGLLHITDELIVDA